MSIENIGINNDNKDVIKAPEVKVIPPTPREKELQSKVATEGQLKAIEKEIEHARNVIDGLRDKRLNVVGAEAKLKNLIDLKEKIERDLGAGHA